MIRAATVDDIPAIVDMARAFHEAHGQDFEFSDESVEKFVAVSIQNGCVLFSERSFFIGFIAPDPANFGRLVAHEAFWWSEEGKGTELRETFEEWAAAMGAVEIQFSHPWDAKRVGKMLQQAGYEPATKVWRKVV